MSTEVDPDAQETQAGSYDRLGCAQKLPDICTMFDDVLTITSELWESAMPALSYVHRQSTSGQCNASIKIISISDPS